MVIEDTNTQKCMYRTDGLKGQSHQILGYILVSKQ
jgi:hypothetical protein